MNLKKIKHKLYFKVISCGIRTLRIVFPELSVKEPLTPSDRYIEYPFVLENLPKPPLKVLDVGCSGSFFPLLLSNLGYDTYGVDVRNYPLLNKLKRSNFTFIQGDIRYTNFPPNIFDAVTAISTIEHIGIEGRYNMNDDLEGDIQALRSIKKILKPGGILIITIPVGKYKIIKPYMKVYDGYKLEELMEGFKIVKECYYMLDEENDWIICSLEDTLKADVKPDKYPLGLFCLKKAES